MTDDEFFGPDDDDTLLQACIEVTRIIVIIVGVTFFGLGVLAGWWLL